MTGDVPDDGSGERRVGARTGAMPTVPAARWRRIADWVGVGPVHAARLWIALPLAAILLVGLAEACLPGGRSTPAFRDARDRVLLGSIARMETWTLGGAPQAVWIRGRDRRAPVLVLLHGGPGASESALFRHFVPGLEDDFVVVYWEQRGTGRSYQRGMPRDSLTIARLERDLDELVLRLRGRFGVERVVLLGHSWGTILGTRYAAAHPDRVSVYIGVAQIADFAAGERLSLGWALQQAEVRRDVRALRALRGMRPAPRSVADELALGRWVERFGGSLRGGLTTGSLLRAALRTPEANLNDLWRFGAGNRTSLEALRPQYATEDLTRLRHFEMPVLLVLGRHDWHVPAVLGAAYYESIDAPCKRLVWFEESAHNPPFEQPRAFVSLMHDTVLPLATGGCPAERTPGRRVPP